ncbi:MAG: hypothetical protein EXR79_06025 [Myxococcales bacterium]|nr:hypothetical protein [Myxococcales bacterium]
MTHRRSFRYLSAVLCALAFGHLQAGSLIGWLHGRAPLRWLPEAAAQAGVNATLGILVIPTQRKAADDAEALERLLTDQATRLETARLFELSPLPAAEANAKAQEQVEEALRALLLRTPKRAQERLAAAAQLLAENPAAGDEKLYARMHKGQALAFLAAGELVKAREQVVKSLVLVPGQSADEYSAYGSTARELYESAREVFKALPTGDIKVVVKGGRGDVWVDGQWKGGGLVQAEDIAAGSHRVTVRGPGMLAERRFVEVVGGKTAVAEFDLKAAPFASDLDQGRNVLIANFNQPSVVEDRVRELRNQLGADLMLLVRPKFNKKNTELIGYFLNADGTFKKIEATVDKTETYLDNLGKFLSDSVGSKLAADANGQPLDQRQSVLVTGGGAGAGAAGAGGYIDPNAPLFEDEKIDKRPITSEWWFWAAVVGGAGLLGGGIWYITRPTEEVRAGATGNLKIFLHKSLE